jgi:hypothetical protein
MPVLSSENKKWFIFRNENPFLKSLASPHGDEHYRGSHRPDERTPRCFYGNELTLGVILSIWLALQAFGSFGIGRAAAGLPVARECPGTGEYHRAGRDPVPRAGLAAGR